MVSPPSDDKQYTETLKKNFFLSFLSVRNLVSGQIILLTHCWTQLHLQATEREQKLIFKQYKFRHPSGRD